MWERVRAMLVKEFIQVLRDPRMRATILVVPVIQLVVFGYAATTDVRNAKTAIMDLDNTPASRALLSRFTGSGYFQALAYVDTQAAAQELVDRGKVLAVFRIDKGFGADVAAGRTGVVQLIVDGTDSNTAGIVLGYAGGIASQYGHELQKERLARSSGITAAPAVIDLRARAWFNENLESRNYYVPGVMSNLVMLVTLILTSMTIVREREIGTMEQVLVTPIRRWEYILGKTAPYGCIAFVNVFLVTTVGVFWFGVPIRGSLVLLVASTALFLMPAVGTGLLVSTICQTQQQAVLSTFLVFFPALLLSGFVFPIANMPPLIQYLTLLNPLRYYLVIIRGIFLKGVGVRVLWPQMAALAVVGVGLLSVATARFRKTQ